MLFTIVVFALSLIGIVALFILKYWELKHEHVIAPRLRAVADRRAVQLKALLDIARSELEKLPPEAVRVTRIVIQEGALGFASLARAAERGAHQLADLVSYKHRFEKRETQSEFLKKVSEHRNENAGGDPMQ